MWDTLSKTTHGFRGVGMRDLELQGHCDGDYDGDTIVSSLLLSTISRQPLQQIMAARLSARGVHSFWRQQDNGGRGAEDCWGIHRLGGGNDVQHDFAAFSRGVRNQLHNLGVASWRSPRECTARFIDFGKGVMPGLSDTSGSE